MRKKRNSALCKKGAEDVCFRRLADALLCPQRCVTRGQSAAEARIVVHVDDGLALADGSANVIFGQAAAGNERHAVATQLLTFGGIAMKKRFLFVLAGVLVLFLTAREATAQRGGQSRPITATPPYPPNPATPPYATHPDLPHYNVIIRHNVSVPMRDGVMLRADIYWPDAPGSFPVLMTRTPYNKDGGENMDVGLRGAQRGFIMVNMDVRGRNASPGEWYPFKYEINDGYDSVEWAAKLPNSDGKVGMWGGSYDGATQFLAAIADPPHLGGIFPMCTASNYYKLSHKHI